MASLENVSSPWDNSRDQYFLSTRGCISLSLVASGHSWWGNASTCAEEKLIPQIASCGKVSFSLPIYSTRRYAMPSYDGSLALGGGHLAIWLSVMTSKGLIRTELASETITKFQIPTWARKIQQRFDHAVLFWLALYHLHYGLEIECLSKKGYFLVKLSHIFLLYLKYF